MNLLLIQHPFVDPGLILPDELIEPPPLDQTLSMSVVNCLEEELRYIITISCYYKDEKEDEGLKFDKISFYIKLMFIDCNFIIWDL